MSKQSLLLVDGDTRSLRVLEVSLRKAGFMVTAASSVQDALDKLELHAPDLIISETTFPDGDGFELRRRVRATADWSEIPFIFLTAEAAIENKIRGLELGVDDYLTKPIYIKEIVTRINILLQKRQRVRFEERRDGRTRFTGRVQDMPVVDVIQTIEISRKSGVIQFVGERGRQAAIYFRDGRVIDAEAGSLQGEDAVYRLLTWSEGEFEVVFRTVRRREVITMSSQALLMEGMRRLDEWSRLFEQLPPLTHRFEVDTIELAARLGDVPDDNNRILRLFDGKRTLLEVIDASDVGDLECLQAISRLYFEELLLDLDHGKAQRRDTGKSLPLMESDAPTPMEEVASGPHERARVSGELAAVDDEDDLAIGHADDLDDAAVAQEAIDRGAASGPRSASARMTVADGGDSGAGARRSGELEADLSGSPARSKDNGAEDVAASERGMERGRMAALDRTSGEMAVEAPGGRRTPSGRMATLGRASAELDAVGAPGERRTPSGRMAALGRTSAELDAVEDDGDASSGRRSPSARMASVVSPASGQPELPGAGRPAGGRPGPRGGERPISGQMNLLDGELAGDADHGSAAGAAGVRTSGEQGASGRMSGEQGASGRMSGEQGASGRTSGEQGASGRTSGEQGASGRTSGEQGAVEGGPGRGRADGSGRASGELEAVTASGRMEAVSGRTASGRMEAVSGRTASGRMVAVDDDGSGSATGAWANADGSGSATGAWANADDASVAGRGADEEANAAAGEEAPVGPLLGGYRPSSLRLIDEAVAAAQAIEPSLFEDADSKSREAEDAHAGNGVARTVTPPPPSEPRPGDDATGRPAPMESAAHLRAAEREESGLRMIGSLGRDRAEASGELAPLGRTRPLRSETARELVTILPRRVTRELPAISQELAESLPTPTPTSSVLTPRPSTAQESQPLPAARPSQRISLPGTGVTTAGKSRGLLRAGEGGPGLGPLLLILLAIVLAGTAVMLRLRRHASAPPRIEDKSEVNRPSAMALPVTTPTDGDIRASDSAARGGGAQRAGLVGRTAGEPPRIAGAGQGAGEQAEGSAPAGADAGRAAGAREGGADVSGGRGVGAGGADRARVDASEAKVGAGNEAKAGAGNEAKTAGGNEAKTAGGNEAKTAGGNEGKAAGGNEGKAAGGNEAKVGGGNEAKVGGGNEAKALYDRAHDALDEGDAAKAFTLAEASLRLRKTARTYLLRAQAEQRLDRVDAALASVNAAAQIAPQFGSVWELQGRILWAARRRDEARVAFERFLALEPTNPRAASVRRLINEPR